jgi:hypothetical protein
MPSLYIFTESTELGFQFGFDGLENLGPDFSYLSAACPLSVWRVRLADKSGASDTDLIPIYRDRL